MTASQSPAPVAPGAGCPAGRRGGGDSPGRHAAGYDVAAHYTGEAVIAAAILWHNADTDEKTDRACQMLHGAVRDYLGVLDGTGYAHRLLADAIGGAS